MRQTSKISVSKLEELYEKYTDKATISLSVGSGEDKLGVVVKHRLSADEAENIVTTVCEGVVDRETGDYHPEWKDYCLRVAVLENYSNITLPRGDERWDMVYGTPVFAMITGHERRPVFFDGFEYDDNLVIDVEQYEQILAAIDQKIEYILRQHDLNQVLQTVLYDRKPQADAKICYS